MGLVKFPSGLCGRGPEANYVLGSLDPTSNDDIDLRQRYALEIGETVVTPILITGQLTAQIRTRSARRTR